MKKRYIGALLLLFATGIRAQIPVSTEPMPTIGHASPKNINPQDDLRWGIKAGINSYNLYGKEIDFIFADAKATYKPSFHLGIFIDNRLGRKLGLKHELLFNQRKVGITLSDENTENYRSTMTRNYIDLMPVSLTFQQGNFQLFAGPYLSALLNANLKRKDQHGKWYKDSQIYGDGANDESENRYLQKFDFGLNLGLEYDFQNRLSLTVRYLHGFTDLFQYANSHTNESDKTNAIKIYNRGWMLSVGYRF